MTTKVVLGVRERMVLTILRYQGPQCTSELARILGQDYEIRLHVDTLSQYLRNLERRGLLQRAARREMRLCGRQRRWVILWELPA